MRVLLLLIPAIWAWPVLGQERQALETPYSPIDFDNHRQTPSQVRQTSVSWASKDNNDLQRSLISGDNRKTDDISARAAAMFEDPEEIPTQIKPEPLPTPKTLVDEITVENYGETTKGQKDLLARARVAKDLNLDSLSEADYELYVAQRRAEITEASQKSGQDLLRPMPTLTNTKTDGTPHMYSVSQAGVGTRAGARTDQNPFEDLIRALRLDHPVTKGTDSLPSPQGRLPVAANTPAVPSGTETTPAAKESVPTSETAKP